MKKYRKLVPQCPLFFQNLQLTKIPKMDLEIEDGFKINAEKLNIL